MTRTAVSIPRLAPRPVTADELMPGSAKWLALALLLPFAASVALLAAGQASPVRAAAVEQALLAYSALVLSFLGGVRWCAAMALTGGYRSRDLGASLLPLGLGWGATFLAFLPALGVLAAAFAAQGAWDVTSAERGLLPRWYGRLRSAMTLAILALFLAAFGLRALAAPPA